MLEHYGINRNNNEIAKSDKNLQYKPRHLSLIIDYLLRENIFRQSIATDKIGVIGHSFYCYTALALAGDKPWLQSDQQIIIHNDPRIKALILMTPAAAYYLPKNSLDQVNIPLLLFIAEQDDYTP